MRDDLNKLLCERERPGSANRYREYRRKKDFIEDRSGEGADLPTREGMKKRYGWNAKPFGENLNPLWGMVRKNVGRPWDKVYSELCSVFNMRSVINQHILDHLKYFVEQNCYEEDEIVYVRSNYGPDRPIKDSSTEYYVHPRTGILLRNKWYKSHKSISRQRDAERKNQELKTRRVIEPGKLEYRKNDAGVWFACELAKIPEPVIKKIVMPSGTIMEVPSGGAATDMWTKEHVWYNRWNRDNTYVCKVRTASHRELKRLGIIQ